MGFGEDGHYASIFHKAQSANIFSRTTAFKTLLPVGQPRYIRYSLNEDSIVNASIIVLVCNTPEKFVALENRYKILIIMTHCLVLL
jgi:6-phosphogluconolactonase/glucosamine-6-phosphate isomerase/deaminase